MTVSATLIGVVPKGEMVKRSGAKPGDDVWVTGNIGDAHLGLLVTLGDKKIIETNPSGEALWLWEEAYRHPKPQLLFRKILRRYATACADISDGLLSEANHIAKASGCGLSINLNDMPLSKPSLAWCALNSFEKSRLQLAVGGDDYELLFTAHSKDAKAIEEAAKAIKIKVTKVGSVIKGDGIICKNLDGQILDVEKLGYNHF